MDSNNLQGEDVQLLEDCWFFGNSLYTKPQSRMLRSFSDPCSSSNFPGNSYEETFESIEKLPLPRRDRTTAVEGSRSNRKAPSKSGGLDRAPSLPASLESSTEEEEEEEIEFSMGKLIRQASLSRSHTRPPRKTASKTFAASSSLTRQKSRRNSAPAAEEPRTNQLKMQKSLKDLEIEELQGFKDLGFDFDEKDLNSKVASIVPALQEKKRVEECEERRPYLSEAWMAHSSAPPVPRWGGKRSTDDMKAQIKFWARAVASNVRQEC